MEEYEVGKTIILEVEVCEYDSRARKCEKCFFFGLFPTTGCTAYPCMPEERSDNTNIRFVEKT